LGSRDRCRDPAGRPDRPGRITWLAEVDGHLVGMMNLAIFERMPRPGRHSAALDAMS
jgi:hypothetical protein